MRDYKQIMWGEGGGGHVIVYDCMAPKMFEQKIEVFIQQLKILKLIFFKNK